MTLSAPAPGEISYGTASLADVLPAALASLGVDGEPNAFDVAPAPSLVLLLLDGLGWNLLQRHAEHAPFLAGLSGRAFPAGFPTTTAVSLASLGTGLPPGRHGITGYTSRLGEDSDPVNWLTWRRAHAGTSLLADFPPEQVQPHDTVFQRAERAGVTVSIVSAHAFQGSGLTRAVLRGGSYVPVFTAADLITGVAAAAAASPPALVYCYLGDLDLIGHGHGPSDPAWDVQLRLIDQVVEMLAERLPPATRLLVTADHGMVTVPDSAKIDFDGERDLSADVEVVAGEARMRHLHVRPGCVDAVRERWCARVGDRVAVLTRAEAIERGWFGPDVTDRTAARIGDLLAVATSDGAVVRSRAEPRVSAMRGHHGALTEDELLVPLLQHTAPG